MKNASRRLSILLLTPFIVSMFLSTFMVSRAFAAPAPIDTGGSSTSSVPAKSIVDQTKSWLYFTSIAKCMSQAILSDGDNIDATSHASSYEWFYGGRRLMPDAGQKLETYPGVLNDSSGDGKVACSDTGLISSALNLWGFNDPIEALCSFGFVRTGGGNDCINDGGNFKKDGDVATKFRIAVNNRYYNTATATANAPTLTDAMKYYLYEQSFLIGCTAKAVGPYEGASPTDINASNTDKGYVLLVVGTDGQITKTIYTAKEGHDHKVTISTTPNEYDERQETCANLVSKANAAADAYAQYQQLTGDPTAIDNDGESSGGEIDTCSVSGNPLSWVLCPIYDGLGSFSDWVLSSILSPFLSTTPISTDPSSTTYKIWSTFRVYGNIFLIIALLVVVFGQSIGGGLVDAYTAKKVLPRLLVAAILINLSIYIVALLVDLTNILGGAIGDAITAPLNENTGLFNISPSGIKAGGFGALIVGTVTATATITGIIAAIVGPIATAGLALGAIAQAIPFLLLFIVVPALLAMLAVFLTLIFRKALILALILVSPVAFALYCLPNTEQYFRKWWDLLFKTLLIYPIVMIIFAIADVLAVTTLMANENKSVVGYLFAFLLQFIPLFMIPFSFKLAGGAIGAAHAALTGYRQRGMETVKGNINNPNSLRNRAKYKAISGLNRQRSSAYTSASAFSKSDKRWRRALGTTAARSVGFGNLERARAQMNDEQDKLAAAQYSTGGDNTIRAFWAKQYNGPTEYYTDSDGRQQIAREKGRWYTYRQPDGSYKEWSAAQVSSARAQVGKDMSRVQAYGKYEMSKAANDGNLEEFMPTFLERVQASGMNEDQANEIWGGIKFAHQQTRKELKYTSIGTKVDPRTGKKSLHFKDTDHAGLSNELVDTMRKGDFSSFRSSTGKKAFEGFQAAKAKVDAGNATAEDKFIYDNYQDLADHLNTSLFGMASTSEAARQAAAQAAAASAGDGETVDSTGYGLGASARAEKEWRNFVMAARRGPAVSGGSTGDASEGGPSTIDPGGNPR